MSPETNLQTQESRQGTEVEATRARPTFLPQTDIYEREDAIVVLAEMPGVSREAVDVDLEGGELTLTGRAREPSLEGHELSYAEYEIGDYQRTFRISDAVDADRIDATMKNGILRVILPKSEKAQPKKIDVKAG